MGHLVRSFDWKTTPLGLPDTWPQSLRTTLSIILNSRFPMFLFWGKELICFYNDAYRPSLGNDGKHPHALGRPGAEVWPEIWAVIKPLIDQVLSGQGATWNEDQLIPIYRNGQIEDVYWTFSYSPVSDESGTPAGVFVTCTETTEKVINMKQLAESKDQLHFAIEAAELGTWDLNPLTNRFTGNDRLKEWFGLPPKAEIELSEAINVMAEGDRKRVEAAIRQALDVTSGGQYDIKYTIINPITKQERVVRAKGKVWFTEDHLAYRFNGILQDVTKDAQIQALLQSSEERYRVLSGLLEQQVQERTEEIETTNEELAATNEELVATNEELAEANRRFMQSNQNLEQFAFIASHDLQEPLRKIQSFGDLLNNQYADQLGEGLTHLQRMQSAASRMSVLIKDLLTFSRISNRRDTMEYVYLSNIIDTVLADLELSITETAAQITVSELPKVQGDSMQLGQLFQNLLSNALKFRKPDTSPVIQITYRTLIHADLPAPIKPTHWAEIYHCIDVTDNGIGFDQKYVDRIFQIFQRLHGKQQYAGTGIGLAICERVVANHGGAITASSELGKGSTFRVFLPV